MQVDARGGVITRIFTRIRLILLAVFGVAAVAIYGFLIEPRRLTITTVQMHQGVLARVLAGKKAVLLSDLHFAEHESDSSRKILLLLETIRPDIIFLTGDYVRWESRSAAYENAINFFSRLSAPLGVYAVVGDADTTYSRKSCEFCHEPGSGTLTHRHGVICLKNAWRPIRTGQGELLVAGIEPAPDSAPAPAMEKLIDRDLPVILLAHSSRVYQDVSAEREVLVLAGDTHGGQIMLPQWLWRLSRRKPDPEHPYGFYRDGKKSLFVSRGVGTSWPHLRLGEPPELVVLQFGEEEVR